MEKEKLIIPRKLPKGEDGYQTFSIRIKDEVVARLEEISNQSGRSRNEIIGRFIEYALDNCEVGAKEEK